MLRSLTLVICASLGLRATNVAADFALGSGYSHSKSRACEKADDQAFQKMHCQSGQHVTRHIFTGCTCYWRGDPDEPKWNCDAAYSYFCGE